MNRQLLCIFLFFSLILNGCVRDDDELFVPDISNQWLSSRNSSFFFSPDNVNVNESEFGGTEDGVNTFRGRFKNYDIEFTFTSGPEVNVWYKGNFVKGSNPLRIVVTGIANGVTLVITRQL